MVLVDDCNVCRERTMCTKPGQAICAACTPHVCHGYLPGDDWCDWCASPIPRGSANPTLLPLMKGQKHDTIGWLLEMFDKGYLTAPRIAEFVADPKTDVTATAFIVAALERGH